MDVWILKKQLNTKDKYPTSYSYKLLSFAYRQRYNKELNLNRIKTNENEKPYVEDGEFFFNISHSKNYICCAISDHEVGVDIEEERKISDKLKERILTKQELESNINPLEAWVIKEAYAKYLSIGLKLDFRTVSIDEIQSNFFMIKIPNDNYVCYIVGKESLKNVYEIDEI
ncbi:MAG: 4'-phosphopantetheinyl transferase superfamily protein [Bacilli bacterium]|nr:4'-phosphopantetheinyl transferase superfamily protein [Bacilli bacterium]